MYTLEDGRYQPRERSACLPALDLAVVCRLAEVEPVSDAIAQLRLELGEG
ncbi:MAG TPA: hypothetical protein VGO00_06210 [Kofleriaceae bacterium]|nr:hypothetical protein [Kofleriaceae bacterium]